MRKKFAECRTNRRAEAMKLDSTTLLRDEGIVSRGEGGTRTAWADLTKED